MLHLCDCSAWSDGLRTSSVLFGKSLCRCRSPAGRIARTFSPCFLRFPLVAGFEPFFPLFSAGCRFSSRFPVSSGDVWCPTGQNQRFFVVLVVTLLWELLADCGRICLQIVRLPAVLPYSTFRNPADGRLPRMAKTSGSLLLWGLIAELGRICQ